MISIKYTNNIYFFLFKKRINLKKETALEEQIVNESKQKKGSSNGADTNLKVVTED